MPRFTLANLAANAFRILGVSGSATQAEIDAAARRMRIWPDPSRIPSTPWDLPALGAVPRSKRDIEQAVTTLQQPVSRIEQRLLWYCGPAPSPVALGLQLGIEEFAPPPQAHDQAIAAMHAAWLADSNSPDASEWRAVMQRFRRLHSQPDYEKWVLSLESRGDFEKRSSPAELANAMRAVSHAMAEGLAAMAHESLEAGNAERSSQLLSIVQESDGGAEEGAALTGMLDRVEDELDARCRELDRELRDKLRTNRVEPEPYFSANMSASLNAQTTYQETVGPVLHRFCSLAAGNPNRLARGRSWAADLLSLLATGWEWSGQYLKAIATLEQAEALAEGSPASRVAIEQQLEQCRLKLQQARERQRSGVFEIALPPTPTWSQTEIQLAQAAEDARNKPRPRVAKGHGKKPNWAVLAAVGVGLLSLVRSLTTNSTSSRPAPSMPTFQMPRLSPDVYQSLEEARQAAAARRRPTSRPTTNPLSQQIPDFFGETTREP